MHASLKLVMFDLDGTLVETGVEIGNAVNATLHARSLAPVTQHQIDGWIGRGAQELMIQALAVVSDRSEMQVRADPALPQTIAQFQINYQHHCGTQSRLYPHVAHVLSTLRARGVKLAVVTNKEKRFADLVLRACEIDDMFDVVLGGDSLPGKKPDPVGLLYCLNLLQVAPAEALFVGDSSIDAAAARNAGVAVWLLTYGYNMHQNVHDCGPDRVIDDFSALLN